LNYHPGDPPPGSAITDSEEYEFIELTNIGLSAINLQNCAFTTGITFTFPSMTLNPGQHVILVKNPAAFTARYGSSIPIAGTYSGTLSNSGERIVLVDAEGQTIHDFTFLDDDWLPAADGPGHSMVTVNPAAATTSWGTPEGWKRSAYIHGSPGATDPPYIEGDYDGSGTVDAGDYVLWRRSLGSTGPIFSAADGDGDGTVDQGDYSVWRAHFGQTLSSAGAGSAAAGDSAAPTSGASSASTIGAAADGNSVPAFARPASGGATKNRGAEMPVSDRRAPVSSAFTTKQSADFRKMPRYNGFEIQSSANLLLSSIGHHPARPRNLDALQRFATSEESDAVRVEAVDAAFDEIAKSPLRAVRQ
jgi:hypothetical protein